MRTVELLPSPSSEGNRIRLVLLAKEALFRTSLAKLLALEPELEVVGECATDEEALELLHKSASDIVLLEIENTRAFITRAVQSGYPGRFLVICGEPDARTSAMALRQGAAGIFLKSDSPSHLLFAIRLVADGQIWMDPLVVRLLADRYPPDDVRSRTDAFTERQQRVLLGILGGLSNRKIGENMKLRKGP